MLIAGRLVVAEVLRTALTAVGVWEPRPKAGGEALGSELELEIARARRVSSLRRARSRKLEGRPPGDGARRMGRGRPGSLRRVGTGAMEGKELAGHLERRDPLLVDLGRIARITPWTSTPIDTAQAANWTHPSARPKPVARRP